MQLPNITARGAVLAGFEGALILISVTASVYLRLGGEAAAYVFANEHGIWKALFVTLVAQICLYYADLYDLRLVADRRELFVRVFQALGAASFLLAAVYYWFPALVLGRGVFIVAAILVCTGITVSRFMFEWLVHRVSPRERLLIVGTSDAAVGLAREIFERRHEFGAKIVGFVDNERHRIGAPVLNPGVIGTIDDIPSIVKDQRVDRVVVSLADARGKLPMQRLLEMKLDGVTFDHLPSVYEEYTGKIAVEDLRPSWLIFSQGFRKSWLLAASKRAADIAAALVGFVVLAPVFAAVAVAVRLTSRGPMFYHQQRVGLRGRVFTIHKFRSMRFNAEGESGPVWASRAGDPRVTPIGGFLRRTRLDELPQLWNILVGEMSLVGPRPERPEFVTELTRDIPYYGQRHIVRPGLTGWAQVRYTYGASTEDALQKLQYDLFYIKNLSLALDLYILFETIKTVAWGKGT